MKRLLPYVHFRGQCRPAMTAYQQWLGGELTLVSVSESPLADEWPGGNHQIYHAALISPEFSLMGSDMTPDGPPASLVVQTSDALEIRRLFALAAAGGRVHCGLAPAPWGGLYAQVEDEFGNRWQMTCDET